MVVFKKKPSSLKFVIIVKSVEKIVKRLPLHLNKQSIINPFIVADAENFIYICLENCVSCCSQNIYLIMH